MSGSPRTWWAASGVTGVVPKGATLMVGNTLRITVGSQLIIKAPAAEGDKDTSILLSKHSEGGAEVVFVPGSGKGDDKPGTSVPRRPSLDGANLRGVPVTPLRPKGLSHRSCPPFSSARGAKL